MHELRSVARPSGEDMPFGQRARPPGEKHELRSLNHATPLDCKQAPLLQREFRNKPGTQPQAPEMFEATELA